VYCIMGCRSPCFLSIKSCFQSHGRRLTDALKYVKEIGSSRLTVLSFRPESKSVSPLDFSRHGSGSQWRSKKIGSSGLLAPERIEASQARVYRIGASSGDKEDGDRSGSARWRGRRPRKIRLPAGRLSPSCKHCRHRLHGIKSNSPLAAEKAINPSLHLATRSLPGAIGRRRHALNPRIGGRPPKVRLSRMSQIYAALSALI